MGEIPGLTAHARRGKLATCIVMMKVFIVVKVPRGNAGIEQLATLLAQQVQKAGHQPFVAYREILRLGLDSPQVFMPFVRQQIRESRLMIVAYHPELRGGLIEAGIAFADGVAVWLLHQAGEQVSSSALGCAAWICAYQTLDDLAVLLAEQLATSART